jgi:hypothetical protein
VIGLSKKDKKKKKCNGSISDIGNPIINVKVSTGEAKKVLKLARPSAFRAINTTIRQPAAADTFIKIVFPTVQFDLAGEYDPASSTFIPSRKGVYLVIGNVEFQPEDPNVNYRTRVEIRINGTPAVAIDNDFFGAGTPFLNIVAVSTIVMLRAGDHVEVFATSNEPGTFFSNEDGLRFEAARFPSP